MTLDETIKESCRAMVEIDPYLGEIFTDDNVIRFAKAALIEAFRYAAEWHEDKSEGHEENGFFEAAETHLTSCRYFSDLISQLEAKP